MLALFSLAQQWPPSFFILELPRLVGSIHKHIFPAESLQVYPLQPGQNLLVQRRSESFYPLPISRMSEPQLFVEEMPTTAGERPLASATSSCSFPVSDVLFQFPITWLWRDYRLRVAFKSLRVEAVCDVSLRLPRCVAGLTWSIHLWLHSIFFSSVPH